MNIHIEDELSQDVTVLHKQLRAAQAALTEFQHSEDNYRAQIAGLHNEIIALKHALEFAAKAIEALEDR